MWWSEMARKTVVKRASKYWPKADRVSTAANVINEHEGLTDDFNEKDVTPTQETVSSEQVSALIEAANTAGVDETYICSKARVSSIDNIEASRFDAAMNHLKGLGIKHESN
jgi:recombinational DNA repair protein RecT